MKKFTFTLLLATLSGIMVAQTYRFNHSNKPYQEVTEPEFSLDNFTENYITYTSPYSCPFFGEKTTDEFTVGITSGYLVSGNSNSGFAADPMMGTNIVPLAGVSSFSVKINKMQDDTSIVFQWKDFGFYNHPTTEVTNFQVHIYLQSKVIAFHYGSNTFSLMSNDSAFSESGASGPELFLVWLTNDFSSLKEFGCLAGSPNSPIYSSNPGRLNSMPANGKYYRFAPNAQTSIKSVHSTPSLDIYPNPASEGVFRIKSDARPISAYTVYDVNGRIVTQKTIQTPLTSLDVELNIPKQLYWIQILLSDGTSIQRKLQIE